MIPAEFDWHLLIGDDTALPAIARRVEELGPDAQVIVVAEVPSAKAQIPLAVGPRAQVHWLASGSIASWKAVCWRLALQSVNLPGWRGLCLGGRRGRRDARRAPTPGGRARRGQGPHPRIGLLEARQRGRARTLDD